MAQAKKIPEKKVILVPPDEKMQAEYAAKLAQIDAKYHPDRGGP